MRAWTNLRSTRQPGCRHPDDSDSRSPTPIPAATTRAGGYRCRPPACDRQLLPDDRYRLRALSPAGSLTRHRRGHYHRRFRFHWPRFHARSGSPLLDRIIPGFGEVFRAISFEEIGTSRCSPVPWPASPTPRSSSACPLDLACRTGWEKIIAAQLDSRTRPATWWNRARACVKPAPERRAGRFRRGPFSREPASSAAAPATAMQHCTPAGAVAGQGAGRRSR